VNTQKDSRGNHTNALGESRYPMGFLMVKSGASAIIIKNVVKGGEKIN